MGRVAVVVSPPNEGERRVTHLGWVKAGPNRTNLDATWVLSSVYQLPAAIPFAEIEGELGDTWRHVQKVLQSRRGGALAEETSAKLRAAIQARVGRDAWPDEDGVPGWMARRLADDIALDQANAFGSALMFSDMDMSSLRDAPLPGESPLAELSVGPAEPSLIDHDLRHFPGMTGVAQREDIVRFTDGPHTLDVMNVNATSIETATGVDLVYYSHDYRSFVLVQYKRMERDDGARIARVDPCLPDQLRRMVEFDDFARQPEDVDHPGGFRLGRAATFTKFAYPVVSPGREADLTRGMYVPSEFLKHLYDQGALVGPRGGQAITHGNVKRWLSNEHFAELVSRGWVGSTGVTASDITAFVAERLSAGRVTVIASHSTSVRTDAR